MENQHHTRWQHDLCVFMIGDSISHYRIVERLAQGGMGEVFLARDSTLNRMVVLKFLPTRFASDPDRLAGFSQEARAASSLNHPNIVTKQPFIVMELVEGETLRALMARGPLPLRRMLDIGTQISDGLAKAHTAGIVHRDLKPENGIVSADGFAKIVDFGLAKLHSDTAAPPIAAASSVAEADTVTGVAPETISGAILYEMATGTRAFQRDTVIQTLHAIIESEPVPLADLKPEFPAPVRRIVERCLAKKPAERYASTLDLARELRGVRDHLAEASSVAQSPTRRQPLLRLLLTPPVAQPPSVNSAIPRRA